MGNIHTHRKLIMCVTQLLHHPYFWYVMLGVLIYLQMRSYLHERCPNVMDFIEKITICIIVLMVILVIIYAYIDTKLICAPFLLLLLLLLCYTGNDNKSHSQLPSTRSGKNTTQKSSATRRP